MITSTTLSTLLRPPPEPVMVIVKDPVWTLLGRVTVIVDEKSGVPDGALKA